MRSVIPCFICLVMLLSFTACGGDTANKLEVEMFKGGFATVNSFIFSNGQSVIVMDVQRKTVEAKKLVERIKAYNLPVTHILITHGHTDHFTGMPLFRDEFPDAQKSLSPTRTSARTSRRTRFTWTGSAPPPPSPCWSRR